MSFPLIKKIVLATHNKGKIKEMKQWLMPLDLSIFTAEDLGISEPEENGKTFLENSTIKATTIASLSQLPSLADDSGLVIPDLKGNPGIHSARWAEKTPGNRDFSFAIEKIGHLLEFRSGVGAFMVCVLTFCSPEGKCHSFTGKIEGTLQFPPRGEKGFGYDPIFQPKGHERTFGEMDLHYKQAHSHRSQAFALFLDFLRQMG